MFGFGFDRMLDKSGIPTPAQILGANYYDHWDYTDAATLSVTGTDINSCTSKGSNAAVMASTGTERPKVLASQINGFNVADFDGINDVAIVATSTGMYNFLHNATGGTVVIIARVNDSNPNIGMALLTNSDISSAKIGSTLFYDDRSSLSRNNTMRQLVSNSTANLSLLNATSNNYYTTQQYNILLSIFNASNATAANRGTMNLNNGTVAQNNVDTTAVSVLNASDNLTLGKQSTTNGFYFKGQIVEVLIANTIVTVNQQTALQNFYKSKYGTFPIL